MTYDDYPAQIWTEVEVGVAIILACMPVCRVVVEHLLPASFLPNSRRYLRTKYKGNNQFLKSGDNTERQAQSDYGVLDEDIEGFQLSRPGAAAVPSIRDKVEEEGQEGSRGLRYTAGGSWASNSADAAFDGEGDGKRDTDVEAGKSIAVQHDVMVTRQGR